MVPTSWTQVPPVAVSTRELTPVPDDEAMSTVARTALSVVAVVAGSLLLGGLTAWAQGVLPDAMASFANSPSGWTVLTALLVATARPTVAWGAALGVVSFVSLVLGYAVASGLRGLAYDPLLWSVVGIIAGPFVGAAAAAVVGRDAVRTVLGAGVLAGVLIADGIYGLTIVSASTSPVYWTLCLVLGALLVVGTAVRLRTSAAAGGVIAAAVAATGVLSLGYAALNGVH